MTLKLCSIAAAVALAFTTAAQAQQTRDSGTTAEPPAAERKADRSTERKVRDAEEDRIDADYKAAKASR